jgi:hypothetical protein
MIGAPPKVFISYSHETVEHQERVLGLADRLRADGIDAEIDQYNASPPEGWPLWCERQIEDADFVLMVCTETYHRRVKGDKQPGQGRGIMWEAGIIRQILYDAGAVGNKFVPVLFSETSPEQIPRPIKGSSWHIVDREDGYERLLRRLTGQPAFARPALGAMRALPARPRHWSDAGVDRAAPPVPTAAGSSTPPDRPTVTAGASNQGERAMSDKGVHIGGNMIGSAAVTGDGNVTTVNYRKVTLPPAASVDLGAELAALKDLLLGLNTEYRQKIANALAEAESDAAKPHPDKNEIGGALERALGYAGKAADFGEKTGKIAAHVQNVVGWLGDNWHKLLPLVGLTG